MTQARERTILESSLVAQVVALTEERDELRGVILLVQSGLRSGSIKSKPIISFASKAETAGMQSLQEIIETLLAKHRPAVQSKGEG